jgi:SAM-dependent methyltransferase
MQSAQSSGHASPAWLRHSLVCPACHSPLEIRPETLACASGSHVFPQNDRACVDLRHPAGGAPGWVTRQSWMEHEYSDLLDDGDHAAIGFENDFRDIAELLQTYSGRLLDIGGGIGIARHWLPADIDYVLLEPSLMWRDARWSRFIHRFPCLAHPCVHIRAFAEALPFADGTFDGALFLWSLNHVSSVDAALNEALRVTVPGARSLIVLEDSEPSWSDVLSSAYPGAGPIRSLRVGISKLLKPARPWPVQRDHIAVSERALLSGPGARVLRREWRGLYLTVELEKR